MESPTANIQKKKKAQPAIAVPAAAYEAKTQPPYFIEPKDFNYKSIKYKMSVLEKLFKGDGLATEFEDGSKLVFTFPNFEFDKHYHVVTDKNSPDFEKLCFSSRKDFNRIFSGWLDGFFPHENEYPIKAHYQLVDANGVVVEMEDAEGKKIPYQGDTDVFLIPRDKTYVVGVAQKRENAVAKNEDEFKKQSFHISSVLYDENKQPKYDKDGNLMMAEFTLENKGAYGKYSLDNYADHLIRMGTGPTPIDINGEKFIVYLAGDLETILYYNCDVLSKKMDIATNHTKEAAEKLNIDCKSYAVVLPSGAEGIYYVGNEEDKQALLEGRDVSLKMFNPNNLEPSYKSKINDSTITLPESKAYKFDPSSLSLNKLKEVKKTYREQIQEIAKTNTNKLSQSQANSLMNKLNPKPGLK